ncbi:MAG: 5-bromo-4-chloroindolyl phosphate hydrolysis family protein [Alphaproteobacteria bacterium]|nr:5-bromo-4-chloroindolyl phosphate hydrolysis family protein [Alphaproteobacteria bacterium]MBL6936944.1 5-bromo-4-chloroindolyl phosphate hydrolysis family protein [Alphaproteobacteria bacterium]MBL7097713.1 5-bromo-4-chloroindolyl phosphate hydrolysis family protein [Alphaproteobacteria bacterium]
MDRGTSTLIAGAAGALAFPVLALVLDLPLWLSLVVSLGVFGGLMLALRPSGFGLNLDAMQEAQSDTVRGLVADGTAALDRIRRIAPAIQDASMKSQMLQLANTSTQIISHVRDDSTRAMAVRRYLTFYLPNAAQIAEGWQTLETNAGSPPERKAQAREVMKALNDAATKYASDADQPELDALDLSLKVVKDSLATDLEKTA